MEAEEPEARLLDPRLESLRISVTAIMITRWESLIYLHYSCDQVDSDNDSPDYKEQFIESGIFEEEEMEMKMEMEKEMKRKAKTKELEVKRLAKAKEAGTQTLEVDQQISQLNEEIVKLTQIRSLVEQRVSPSSTKDPPDASKASEYPSSVNGAGAVSSPLSKVSEYGSCEELEMINGPGRWEVHFSQNVQHWIHLYQRLIIITTMRFDQLYNDLISGTIIKLS